MEAKEIIGLDVGQKRTGIARASSVAKIAEPLRGVDTDRVFDELMSISKAKGIQGVVIGLPRNLNGDDTAQTEWVRTWAEKIKPRLGLTMYWQDEALTSNAGGDNKDDHAKAAAVILQDFLDTPEEDRVIC